MVFLYRLHKAVDDSARSRAVYAVVEKEVLSPGRVGLSHTVLLNIRIFGYRAEQSIRGFCIGKKNWVMIDTIAGARSSAIVYSIAETAKANNLKPYDYFEYLLTEIPKHREDTDRTFLDDLLPWSTSLPENCRKPDKMK